MYIKLNEFMKTKIKSFSFLLSFERKIKLLGSTGVFYFWILFYNVSILIVVLKINFDSLKNLLSRDLWK